MVGRAPTVTAGTSAHASTDTPETTVTLVSLDILFESVSWADSPLSSLFESFELLSTGAMSPPNKSRTIFVSGFSSYSTSLLSSRYFEL